MLPHIQKCQLIKKYEALPKTDADIYGALGLGLGLGVRARG